jgi:hypothetical protein
MAEISATKTPRILAAMKNLSTLSVTYLRLLHFEQGGKVLTVCARAQSLVWRGFWRVSGVEKTEEGFGKKDALFARNTTRKALSPSRTLRRRINFRKAQPRTT